MGFLQKLIFLIPEKKNPKIYYINLKKIDIDPIEIVKIVTFLWFFEGV